MLLLHDQRLPSVTRLVAGEPVQGSWWGHARGKDIFAVLVELDREAITAKLVGGKLTLLHRRLWPALAAVGRSDEPWQHEGLKRDARIVLDRVHTDGAARTDRIALPEGSRKVGTVADDLERRLLVASTQVHTESGRHARALETWRRWMKERQLRVSDLPRPRPARETLAAPVIAWVGEDEAKKLLPWLQ